MSEFSFQINYDENSYTVMGYKGNSEEVIVPVHFAPPGGRRCVSQRPLCGGNGRLF